ncbi:MAG: hypothetical protein QOF48_1667 [Verrucomicrobiota bacterium]|jgi:hypothetical protein
MKKRMRWVIGVLTALLALAVTALFCRDPFLKLAAARAIHKCTGMKVEIAKFKTGLRNPAMTMQGVKIYNYGEFGDSLFMDMPNLLVEFDQEDAAQGRLHFKKLRVELAELNVLRDRAGRWNLEKVEKEMTERNAARTKRSQPRLSFGGIDEMHISVARVTFKDLQKSSKSREILVNMRDEVVTGIHTDEELQEWIGSFIFRVILQEAVSPTSKRKGKPIDALKEALEK